MISLEHWEVFDDWPKKWETDPSTVDNESAALLARTSLDRVAERLLPKCDDRCRQPHDPDEYVTLADLQLQPTSWPSDPSPYWEQPQSLPPMPASLRLATAVGGALVRGTRVRRLTATSLFVMNHDTVPQLTLFEVAEGSREGQLFVAVTYGPSSFSAAEAGSLIVPDHPPTRDDSLVNRLRDLVHEMRTRGEAFGVAAGGLDPWLYRRELARTRTFFENYMSAS